MSATNAPRAQMFRSVAETFRQYREAHEQKPHVDMRLTGAYTARPTRPDEPLCGTVACVSGHYAMATTKQLVLAKIGDLDRPERRRYPRAVCQWIEGADRMANDLGFTDHFYLLVWAYKHPKIWGNDQGAEMFQLESAWFESRTSTADRQMPRLEILDVADHLYRVASRLDAQKTA